MFQNISGLHKIETKGITSAVNRWVYLCGIREYPTCCTWRRWRYHPCWESAKSLFLKSEAPFEDHDHPSKPSHRLLFLTNNIAKTFLKFPLRRKSFTVQNWKFAVAEVFKKLQFRSPMGRSKNFHLVQLALHFAPTTLSGFLVQNVCKKLAKLYFSLLNVQFKYCRTLLVEVCCKKVFEHVI